jgi:aminoglycoside/choline kinase family phosphotransferase
VQAQALVRETRLRFPRLAASDIAIEPVRKGGSDRKYYRINVGSDQSLILVKYGQQRAENSHYVDIARFLASLGIQVPEIYYHDEIEGLIWMEDLGQRDLCSCSEQGWDDVFPLYANALDQAVVLHTRAADELKRSQLTLQAEFNLELYCWEQNYFFENCLARYFGIQSDVIERHCNRNRLNEIAEMLHRLPRVLVHRDFQSQNIMIVDERAYLIDFQGLRPGLPHYDLASIVYDPYVSLNPQQRQMLVSSYLTKLLEDGVPAGDDFTQIFDLCAMQRLMQALGAYGYLGLVKKHEQFLAYVPAALNSLREVLERIEGLNDLQQLLSKLPRD